MTLEEANKIIYDYQPSEEEYAKLNCKIFLKM